MQLTHAGGLRRAHVHVEPGRFVRPRAAGGCPPSTAVVRQRAPSTIGNVVGIAAGQGPVPVWVFGGKITDASLLDFYDDLATRPRWEIGERGATMLIHRRGGARLSIGATNAGRIIDTLLP